ncbi:MAG: tetratricopeptide repeat protein [candidate division WOR-3 bacterium]
MLLWVFIFQEGNQAVEEEEVVTGKAEFQITGYERPLYFYMPPMGPLVSSFPGWNEIFNLKFEDSLKFVNSFNVPQKPKKKGWSSGRPGKSELDEYYNKMAQYGVGLIRVGLFKEGVNALSEVVEYSGFPPEVSYVVRTYYILGLLYSGDDEGARSYGSIFLSDYYNRPWNIGMGWVIWAAGEANLYGKHFLQAESIYAKNINEGQDGLVKSLSRVGAAWANLYAQKFSDALSHAKQSQEFLNGVPLAHAQIAEGIATFNLGDIEGAKNIFDNIQITGHPPTDVLIYYYRGFNYEALRMYDLALQNYQKVMQDYANLPTAGEAAYRTYTIYLGQNKINEAKKTLEWFVERFPQHPEAPRALYTLSEIYFSQKDYKTALSYLRKIYINYPNSELYSIARQRAQQVYNVIAREDTVELWNFLREFPNSDDAADALIYWGGKLLDEKRELLAARFYYKMGSEFPKHRQAPEALFTAGQIYFKNKMWDDAVQTFGKIVDLYPNYEEVNKAKLFLAISLIYDGKPVQAISILKKELGRGDLTDAERADLLKYLGIAYKEIGKSYEARDALEEARVLYFGLGKLDEVDNVDKLLQDIPY